MIIKWPGRGTGKQQAYSSFCRPAGAADCSAAGMAAGGGAGQPLDHRARRVARATIAHRIEQRRGRAGAANQGLRIGQHNGIVPRALHDERQLESGRRGIAVVHQDGGALEIEFARRNGGRAGERQPHRRAVDLHVLDRDHALADLQQDRDLLERGAPAAEFAAARQRPPLQAAQQLLHVEAGERAVLAGEVGGAVQGAGDREHAVAAAFDRESHVALAFEPVQPEQLAEAAFQVHVGELQLGFDIDAGIEIGQRQRSPDHAAIGLRLAHGHHQMAAAQVGADGGAAELGIRHHHVARRQP